MSAATMDPWRSDMKAHLFVAGVIAAGAAVLAASLRHAFAAGLVADHVTWLGLALLTVLAGRLSVALPIPHCRLSLSDPLIFLTVLVFGPSLATLTAALDGFAASMRAGGNGTKRAFNTASMAISVYLSSRVFRWMALDTGLWDPQPRVLELTLAVIALAMTQYLINSTLVSTVVALKEHISLTAVWEGSSPWAGSAHLVASAAAVLIFFVVRDLGTAASFAILPVPPILHVSYRICLKRVFRVSGA